MIKDELKKFPPGNIGGEIEWKRVKNGKKNSTRYTKYFETGESLSSRKLNLILKKRGLTFKDWYDYHYLSRDESGEYIYPKCRYCGRVSMWDGSKYRCYCEECHPTYESEIQRTRALNQQKTYGPLRNDLQSFIKRHGEEEGHKKYEEYCRKISRSRTLEGMKENHGEEEGAKLYEKMCKDISFSHSLSGKIEIYGEEGIRKHKESIKRRNHSISRVGHIEKYGEIEGNILYEISACKRSKLFRDLVKICNDEKKALKVFKDIQDQMIRSRIQSKKCSTLSHISRIFFKSLVNRLESVLFRDIDISEDLLYGNNEARIKTGKAVGDVYSSRKPDFLMKSKRIIIEFQGSYWHPRPESSEFGINEVTDRILESSRIDYYKLLAYRNLGYYVFYVYEYEYYDNPDLVIEECIKFITNREFREEYTNMLDQVI